MRVPTDNIKLGMQVGEHATIKEAVAKLVAAPPGMHTTQLTKLRRINRGFGLTLFRDIPFAAVQFPIYEQLRLSWAKSLQVVGKPVQDLPPLESSLCGGIAGSIAAIATCPFDVIKTRYQLSTEAKPSLWKETKALYQEGCAENPTAPVRGGTSKFFLGVVPRLGWIGIGGWVFFGAFEGARSMMDYAGMR